MLEGIVNLTDELLMVDVAGTDDNKVVAEIVSSLEGSKIINRYVGEHICISFDWLTEHVITISVEVSVFQSSVFKIFGTIFVISCNFTLEKLKLARIKSGT